MSYYDQDGKPITQRQWLDAWGEIKNRTIARTQVGRFLISTVWLGLNHQYGDGPPLIFETMIFDEHGADIGCQRYSTKEAALVGHKDAERWIESVWDALQEFKQTGYWPEFELGATNEN